MGQQSELLIRLAIGTILGAIIGYERHVHGRPVYELISWSGSPPRRSWSSLRTSCTSSTT
jgi:hypothetical protein